MLDNTLAYNKTSKFCFFDLETYNLCLSFIRNRCWQATFITLNGDKTESVHDLFIKWPDTNLKIGAGAAAVTHYDENVFQSKAITDKEAWPIVYNSLETADFLVGHNIGNFDFYLIKDWYKMNGLDYRHLIPKMIDTKALSIAFKLGLKKPASVPLFEWQLQFMNFRQKGLKSNLSLMAKSLDIQFDEKLMHNSAYDLDINIQLFNKLKFSLDL